MWRARVAAIAGSVVVASALAPMQLSQALTSLEGVLARAGGAGALTQLAHTKVGASAGQAEAVAVAEIAKANPGGALAALLIAHQDDPHEARHLENAAVVAISMGSPTGGCGGGKSQSARPRRTFALLHLSLASAADGAEAVVAEEPAPRIS